MALIRFKDDWFDPAEVVSVATFSDSGRTIVRFRDGYTLIWDKGLSIQEREELVNRINGALGVARERL